MHVELVRTVTRDGLRLDGAYAAPQRPLPSGQGGGFKPPGQGIDAALLLHGVAGNFYTSSTFEPVIERLRDLGIATLAVNTRGHDLVYAASLGNVRRCLGAAYEIVDDCRHDVTAWIEWLASRGHQRLALVGHSLGAIKAVYSQAHEAHSSVVAVVAASPPRLSYQAFTNSNESGQFFAAMNNAESLAKAGRGQELFTSSFPFPLLIEANAYIDKYGPAERYNLLNFAGRLQCPALFTYGGKELVHGGIAFENLPEILRELPGGDRRQVTVVEGADHMYTGRGTELAGAVADWLRGIVSAS
jgi:pimeloyl-ACP methyl ester carboxylesterase